MTTTTRRPTNRPALRPTGLTVLHDAACPVCRGARRWVERQRHLVPVRFVAAGSAEAARRFPHLDVGDTFDDVTVVTDDGAVLRDDAAWIAVLWAVARTRGTAIRIARGRHRRLFGRVKGATELIRKVTTDDTPTYPPTYPHGRRAPSAAGGADACSGCDR